MKETLYLIITGTVFSIILSAYFPCDSEYSTLKMVLIMQWYSP